MAMWVQEQLGIRTTPLQCLASMDGMKVREKVRVIEAVSALLGQEIEMANMYKVFSQSNAIDDKFYAVEQTGPIFRNLKMLFGDCTPWQLDIMYAEGLGATQAFKVERPFSLTCCCLNRPAAYMKDIDGNEIGSLHDPWTCCGGLDFTVRDPEGTAILALDGGMFQPGFWCPMPCGEMKNVRFKVKDLEKGGEEVGIVTKGAQRFQVHVRARR